MAIDRQTWVRLHSIFEPGRRLSVDEQHLYVARPDSVIEDIAGDIQDALRPEGKWIVCGSKGSGKSTELVRLAGLLQNTHTVVAVNVAESVSNINTVQAAEVLFLIGAAAIRTAKLDLGHEIPSELVGQLLQAFEGLLSEEHHGIDVGKILEGVALFAASAAGTGVGAAKGAATAVTGALGSKAQMALRHRPKLGGTTLPIREGRPEMERLRIALDDILVDLHARRQVVVVIDGLDQLTAEEPIRELFSTSILASPYGQIVYGAPIDLMLMALWKSSADHFNRRRLTNVLVRKPDLERVDVGQELIDLGRHTMKELVRRRLESLGLKVEDLFVPSSLDVLIDASGGVMRDYVQNVREAVRLALKAEASRIDGNIAENVVREARKELSAALTTRRVEELRHVRATGEAHSDEEPIRELLRYGFILPYANGTVWFEPHPILRGLREGI